MARVMNRLSSLCAWILSATLVMSTLGCGAAFRNAMRHGDAYARQGNWDAAAESYATAVDLDPDSPEARAKLVDARRRQAALRVERSRWHLGRGEFGMATWAAREAMMLDRESVDARTAYENARNGSFARIDVLMGEGKLEDALELIRALRRADPTDRKAADLEARCLDTMAQRAYDRAMAFVTQKKLGNALLALNEVQRARPGYRDVQSQSAEIRTTLENEIEFVIHVDRAAGTDRNSLTTRVEDELLQWKREPRFRLSRTTDQAPSAGSQAVRISPRMSNTVREHTQQMVRRSCEYVCGVDRVANPEHEVAKRRVSDAERHMRQSERRLGQVRTQLQSAKQEATTAKTALQVAEGEERTAQSELNACRVNLKPGETCTAEESKLERAKQARESAELRERAARDAVFNAENDVRNAEMEVSSARANWDHALTNLSTTPTTVLVNRICTHNYGVEIHSFTGASTLSLTAIVLGDSTPVNLPPKPVRMEVIDESFQAVPDRCAEVAAGDPLQTPTDSHVEAALAAKSVEEIRIEVATWYTGYVNSYVADETTARAAGRVEDANEAYIRHRLLGPGLAY
jgi:tetratricopeptide (TPR) repeat protein